MMPQTPVMTPFAILLSRSQTSSDSTKTTIKELKIEYQCINKDKKEKQKNLENLDNCENKIKYVIHFNTNYL